MTAIQKKSYIDRLYEALVVPDKRKLPPQPFEVKHLEALKEARKKLIAAEEIIAVYGHWEWADNLLKNIKGLNREIRDLEDNINDPRWP